MFLCIINVFYYLLLYRDIDNKDLSEEQVNILLSYDLTEL